MLTSKAPLITIIIPTYNRKELLEKAILSVINQKKDISFDRELIIVDDGSQDDTKAYIQKYLDTYPQHIQYYYQNNTGVWSARNTWLSHMSASSDYVIFLDSDDELMPDCLSQCLTYINNLDDIQKSKTLGLYFLCRDEEGSILWREKMLKWWTQRSFWYDDFLSGQIAVEMWFILKSYIFLQDPNLRFPEDVVTEGIVWSKMRKYMEANGLVITLRDYAGRLYRRSHTWYPQITKTVSVERCLKNALWGEQLLDYIGDDLLQRNLAVSYADHCFRIGVNYILAGENAKGRSFLHRSLSHNISIATIIILCLSYVAKPLIRRIYTFYIYHE